MTDMRATDEIDALLRRANDDLMAQVAKAFDLPRYIIDGSKPTKRERFWKLVYRLTRYDRWR